MVMMMMTSLEMGSLSFNQQINHGIMGDQNLPYSGDISSSELTDDGSISSGCSSPASPVKVENGALGDMSTLLQQLPIKRGLSKYFNGKSQSYSSLSNVTCLEDLAKPENPYNNNKKKLKSCKSYMCFSEAQKSPPNVLKSCSSSKLISKKSSSRTSCSSSSMASSKRNGSSGFINGNNNGMNMKPPTHPTPLRSSSTSGFNNCTPLFA